MLIYGLFETVKVLLLTVLKLLGYRLPADTLRWKKIKNF
jgi:hypothetical protein